jgi:MerR family transcriptional regulator, thiopeptide resistance regulator
MAVRESTYTVKQLSTLAGVSIRTLHYYDEISLLKPDAYGENGYRYYGEGALLRLQQILFFRELDFSLAEIQSILDRPDFDLLQALLVHRKTLRGRIERLERLVQTVDKTIQHLKGEVEMSNKEYYDGFTEEKQKEYEQYARRRWGDETYESSARRWNALSAEEKKAYGARGDALIRALAANMEKGYQDSGVQALIGQYRAHQSFFYEVTLEIFEGLGHGYNQHPDFIAFYDAYKPGLAAFMEQAITFYCQQNQP